jgi:hypothetical protein
MCLCIIPSLLFNIIKLIVSSSVIHILLTVEQALKDLPLLLSNPSQTPANTDDNPGSKNYGRRPRIVAIGGGHSEENFREMKAACKDVEKGIIWVRNVHFPCK